MCLSFCLSVCTSVNSHLLPQRSPCVLPIARQVVQVTSHSSNFMHIFQEILRDIESDLDLSHLRIKYPSPAILQYYHGWIFDIIVFLRSWTKIIYIQPHLKWLRMLVLKSFVPLPELCFMNVLPTTTKWYSLHPEEKTVEFFKRDCSYLFFNHSYYFLACVLSMDCQHRQNDIRTRIRTSSWHFV